MVDKITKFLRPMVVTMSAILIITGCLTQQMRIKISELGFSMKVPQGWKLGRSAMMQEFALQKKFYFVKKEGTFCFKSEAERFPYISVSHSALSEYKSLSSYVDIAKLIFGRKILSQKRQTICGLESIEVTGEGFSVLSKTLFLGIYVFVRKGNKVIWVSLCAPKKDFDTYKSSFRKCINSINIS